ncbi:Uncharacterised protein [uncultured archaeon]|nr:Uncharacterised protein [uncultured archaeon]
MNFSKTAILVFALILISFGVFAAPVVSDVTSTTANGAYKAGDTINVRVDFNELVNISGGTPTITLSSGGSAAYIGGDQTGVLFLDFNYVIASGQSTTDLDYSSTGSLTGGGATIVSNADASTAILTLPATGGAGSLANAKNIQVDTAAPSCTISSPADGNYFNSTTISGITFSYTCTDATAIGTATGKIDGNTVASGTALSTIVSAEKTYSITLDANDSIGNTMTQMTRTFVYDNTAPSSGSISLSGWTNLDKPTFTISTTHSAGTSGVTMAFSCNASAWTSWVSYATSYADFNINNNGSYGCSRSDWNKTIYVKFRDGAGNTDGNTYSTTVLYDNVAPSPPTDISSSPDNGAVTLYWDEPAADNNSGNYKVEIYMNGAKKTDVNYGAASYNVTGLSNGTSYRFKLRTSDRAGNYSSFTTEFTITPAEVSSSITIEKNGVAVTYVKAGDVIAVSCEFSDDANNARIIYKSYSPTSSDTNLKVTTGLSSSIEANYTIPTNVSPDRYGFWCRADNSPDSSTLYTYFDDESPEVNWLDSNNTFAGTKRVVVTASDNRFLNKVEFEFNNATYSSIKQDVNFYFDLNTLLFENGNYTLKTLAYDLAGNVGEKTRNVSIENVSTAKQKAQKAIQTAIGKQSTANDLIAYFKKESILIQAAIKAGKDSADSNLSAAQGLLLSNPEGALAKANSAITAYDIFNNALKVETTATKIYSGSPTGLADTLRSLGFSEELIAKAQNLTQKAGVERKIKLIKVAGAEGKLQVKLELSISNDTNETELKIMEIIPKELINSARSITSDTNFIILKDDPIIQFDVNLAKSAKMIIAYGLGEMSTGAANLLIDQNVLEKFTAPPVVLQSSDEPKRIIQQINLGDPLLIGIIILIIAAIIIVVLFVRFAHPGHKMGEPKTIVEHLTPEKEPEKPKWSSP